MSWGVSGSLVAGGHALFLWGFSEVEYGPF